MHGYSVCIKLMMNALILRLYQEDTQHEEWIYYSQHDCLQFQSSVVVFQLVVLLDCGHLPKLVISNGSACYKNKGSIITITTISQPHPREVGYPCTPICTTATLNILSEPYGKVAFYQQMNQLMRSTARIHTCGQSTLTSSLVSLNKQSRWC